LTAINLATINLPVEEMSMLKSIPNFQLFHPAKFEVGSRDILNICLKALQRKFEKQFPEIWCQWVSFNEMCPTDDDANLYFMTYNNDMGIKFIDSWKNATTENIFQQNIDQIHSKYVSAEFNIPDLQLKIPIYRAEDNVLHRNASQNQQYRQRNRNSVITESPNIGIIREIISNDVLDRHNGSNATIDNAKNHTSNKSTKIRKTYVNNKNLKSTSMISNIASMQSVSLINNTNSSDIALVNNIESNSETQQHITGDMITTLNPISHDDMNSIQYLRKRNTIV
jgi:hypothetical protein